MVLSCSAFNASISRPTSLESLSSSIAVACFSVNERFFASATEPLYLKSIPSVLPVIRHVFAILTVLEPLIISIIKSITSHASIRPS